MEPTIPAPPKSRTAALLQQALSLQQRGNLREALDAYRQILAAESDHFDALHGMGILCGQMGRFEEALGFIVRAAAIQPGNFSVHYNRGKALQGLRRHDEALHCYDRALDLNPGYAPAHLNRGNVLRSLGRDEGSLACYDRALALQPDLALAHYNRGNLLKDLRSYEQALAAYDRALSLNMQSAELYDSRGCVLKSLRRYEEAMASFAAAIALRPDYAAAYYNRGLLLINIRHYQEALANFDRAIALAANIPYARGYRAITRLSIGSWEKFADDAAEINHLIESNIPASEPFPLLALPTVPETQRKCAALYAAKECPPAQGPLWNGDRYRHERIRLGYFSADLYNHATAQLMAGLFEKHDRSRFEVIAFSYGRKQQDGMRTRLIKAFDRFIDVSDQSEAAIAALARNMEIDIAVDLKGYTLDSLPGIFARRPAPIQVNYLGFPGTLGAPYIDYIIADPVVIPREHFAAYTEKVVHLPRSYQANDSRRPSAAAAPARAALGLPETGFVFCCFNHSYKITPEVFSVWMRLLARVEGSVLCLLETNGAVRENLGREARNRGIDPRRLVFVPRVNSADHLARHRLADLFLDTFRCNAHTTASDALWAGLPVLTCLGNTFAGRVAASLLNAVGLPELIAATHEEYEALALHLATHPQALAAVRRKLADNRLTQPLFDTELFAKHIEAAYKTMWRRRQQGLAPDHIRIEYVTGQSQP